ncbi:hypothetical protein HanRHA438_Chr02g0059181 [Helianthus annuus]|uniref:Uncharacterized protein n=1 Tax=Helianthus annuus TaxID=4232 RepID=A0A9K3JM81_HELAN|nr:hypothetical protein HanXRQr2_Chr02g0057431 [Helianthus annuus]KAJ0604234.1 hypothetical protein HanHA300_Chr02g0047391 [Helianthus annuus]KAJ0614688.1 hypothetical protein HanIR_Chr02g0065231 [Helianthus annuus]KAJ0618250.1 hypothetical protein HanHA89_Chr02g0051021 [Helianthus annuus]KAJ0776712.1 hypothetical protein HanLR1_Chr02g0048781 [Helianthus annuus]
MNKISQNQRSRAVSQFKSPNLLDHYRKPKSNRVVVLLIWRKQDQEHVCEVIKILLGYWNIWRLIGSSVS